MMTSKDLDRLAGHLSDIRGEARVLARQAEEVRNADAKATLLAMSNDQLDIARSLHRVLLAVGVKGLGEVDY